LRPIKAVSGLLKPFPVSYLCAYQSDPDLNSTDKPIAKRKLAEDWGISSTTLKRWIRKIFPGHTGKFLTPAEFDRLKMELGS
jgi:hypothetical protein